MTIELLIMILKNGIVLLRPKYNYLCVNVNGKHSNWRYFFVHANLETYLCLKYCTNTPNPNSNSELYQLQTKVNKSGYKTAFW